MKIPGYAWFACGIIVGLSLGLFIANTAHTDAAIRGQEAELWQKRTALCEEGRQ